ncbi:MAG TPA: AI-2E family transporter [Candidatus Acidoferrum sp.]
MFDPRTARVLTTSFVFALVLAIVYAARGVIIVFVFAILFAYLIDPVVRFLQRHSLFFKNLRGPHIWEAYLGFLILIAIAIHGMDPGFFRHAGTRIRALPTLSEQISTGEVATKLGEKYGWTDVQQLRLKSFLIQHHSRIQGLLEDGQRIIPTAIGSLVLIPILALFFLNGGPILADSVIQLVSTKDNLENLRSFASELALGVMAGVLEFIPVAGWKTSATIIITIGALTHSHWIWMAALLGLWRMSMDYFISPRVVGHELEMHPLLAIFTVMVGGAVGGIVGIYLSVPIVATLRVVYRRFGSNSESGLEESQISAKNPFSAS